PATSTAGSSRPGLRPRRCISTSAAPRPEPAPPSATAARAYRSGRATWSRPRPRRRVTTCSALPATLRSATATCRSSYEGSKATFLEDADMLEAVQANRCGGSLDGLVDIGADAAQLQARRMLAQMIAAESA